MRSVKPEFFQDQDFAVEVPDRDARLLYIGLWGLADEHGRLRGDAQHLKGQLFAYDDDLTPDVIDKLVDVLEQTGRAVRYWVRSSVYLFLPKLAEHQRLEPSKVPSRLPEPPAELLEQSSEKITDESARDANKSAPKHAASSRLHVAGQRGADNPAPSAAVQKATRLIVDAAAVTPELAAEVVQAIARERKPRNLPGLVSIIIAANDLGEWFPKAEAALRKQADAAYDAQARASPECPHGMPGGLNLHPRTGKPLCPLCRKGAPA